MKFQRRFPHPKRKKEEVIITWTGGYDQTEVMYKDSLIGVIEDPKELIEGTEFLVDGLGEIKVVLFEDPYDLHVFFNGLHSPANTNHPKINIGSVSLNFFLPIILNGIIFIRLYSFHILDKKGTQYFDGPLYYLLLSILGISFLGMSTGVILLFKRKIVGFLVAGIFFYLEAFLFVVSSTFLNWGESVYVLWLVQLLHIFIIPIALLRVLEYKRHLIERNIPTEELLDDPVD